MTADPGNDHDDRHNDRPNGEVRHGGDDQRGVYGISVAAELTGLQPQNLRFYEDQGLLKPERTPGGTRRYSDADLAVLRRIAELLSAGLNIAGIKRVLDLETENTRLRGDVTRLTQRDRAGGRSEDHSNDRS